MLNIKSFSSNYKRGKEIEGKKKTRRKPILKTIILTFIVVVVLFRAAPTAYGGFRPGV